MKLGALPLSWRENIHANAQRNTTFNPATKTERNAAAADGVNDAEDEGCSVAVPLVGLVTTVGEAGGPVVVDGGAVVVVPDGEVLVPSVGAAAAATVTASFIPPLQWPGMPQM